jgi:alpha,alpha-trehalose phosphorylase
MQSNIFDAAIFDMDGVVTRTTALHAAAWKELFDDYLRQRERRGEPAQPPFDLRADYLSYVDGKPRAEGARSFLSSRGITLPYGEASDPPDRETLCGLGNRKDALFERRLRAEGAGTYDSTVALIEALRAHGMRTALVTSSRHGREVLGSAGVIPLFDVILDGADALTLGLAGKPAPDLFRAAAERLSTVPRRCLVFEDAVAGVQAGRAGGFGLVIGIDRGDNRQALLASGADLVVSDTSELSLDLLEARFREQAAGREQRESAMLEQDAWRIEQEGFDPAREHEVESLFTVGNGYLGVRGALDTPLPGSRADLFVAGIYDRKQSSLPYSELEFLTEDRGDYPYSELVSLPFPFALRMAVDGRPLDLLKGLWREHRRTLDLQRALLLSYCRFEDEHGRSTVVETWRCASLADPHLLMQEVRVTCENYSALVEIDASPWEPELDREYPHLRPLAVDAPQGQEVRLYTTQASNLTVALAHRARLADERQDRLYWQAEGRAGTPLRWRRYICIYTSRDGAAPAPMALAHLGEKRWEDFDGERAAHEARWADYWRLADVQTASRAATTQALRFNAYHLRIAADHDPKVSVAARTLSGRAYEGHVFWDVEIFMLPFYLHVSPDIARSLLLYRYHTLDGARQRAHELGYRGACYAWESTVTGADTTPRRIVLKTTAREIPIYTGFEQIHVTADVAYGVWRYFEAMQDSDFMAEAGAEILFETGRFWASRCVREAQYYHIRGVTGPDEYHHTVDDNAYTNWMARFNLQQAVWAAYWLAEHRPERWEALRAALALGPDELAAWEEVARALYCPQPGPSGVIEQFEGFFWLREYHLTEAERFRPPLRRLFEAEEVNRTQLIKQADVLMLPFLFPEQFSPAVLAANYHYYEPRTDHGSSLSPPVHAALAARLGLKHEAQRYWRRSLWLDLSNTMGNSALGIHAACMAGTWQALVFGFLGIHFSENGPVLATEAATRLPQDWRTVDLKLAFRGRVYPVHVARQELAS